MSNPTVKNHVAAVLKEYRANKKGTAFAYIRLARKLAASGLTKTKALEIISTNFPAEHRAFLAAQDRGDILPPLFPKAGPTYAEKRKLATARGGIIA